LEPSIEPVPGDVAIGDDGGARAGPQHGQSFAQPLQLAPADDDVVSPLAKRNFDDGRFGIFFQWRGHGVMPILPS
jgi:hypothetical protein